MKSKTKSNQNYLSIGALVALSVSSISSLYFMFNVGRNQKSILLLLLFTGWVLSPFVGLVIANTISKPWLVLARKPIYKLMVILSIASFIAYSGILSPTNLKPAFMFLIVPLASWVIILIFILFHKINFSEKQHH